MDLLAIIEVARERRASDIHFTDRRPPLIRVDGALISVGTENMNPQSLEAVARELAQERYDEFLERGEIDFTFQAPHNRLRVNIYRQRGVPAAALRLIPETHSQV
jgi:twitching motility protein PilT